MLTVTTATSLDQLAAVCASVLRDPLEDPFMPEWIATPNGAIRGWLTRQLASHLGATDSSGSQQDGVAANITKARVDDLRNVLRGLRPADIRDHADPWSTDAITWNLMALVATGVIDRHGGTPPPPETPTEADDFIHSEPLATWARRQARRFDRYHLHRPDMILDWLANTPTSTTTDQNEAEQAALYRALTASTTVANPVTALAAFDRRTHEQALPDVLPQRLMFFGFMLPTNGDAFRKLIDRVAATRDVHCYFLDPAPGVEWNDRAALTRSWGRDDIAALHMQRDPDPHTRWTNLARPSTAHHPTHLGALQTHIARANTRADNAGPCDNAPNVNLDDSTETDRSIVVHDCHGLTRQIEVLRDELLRRLVDDPTLTEEDIVVFAPDLTTIAPVVSSVLGESAGPFDTTSRHTPKLRYHFNGLPSRYGNPVAEAFTHLLHLVTGRVTSRELIAFLQLAAVRNRWGFSDDDIEVFRDWARELNVRWGLDARHRTRFGIAQTLTMGTWSRAIERLALGAAYASDTLILDRDEGPTSPRGVEGDDTARLGSLYDIVARLADVAASASDPLPVSQRLELLTHAIKDLFAPTGTNHDQLDAVLAVCENPRGTTNAVDFPVTLEDLRPFLLARLERRGSASSVFRGGVTFTTPENVRGVPYRVVTLLDMGDHWVPAGVGDGGDLMAGDFRNGDPEPRRDARSSLLSAVTSATDALIITRTATSLVNNDEVPEGVLLDELFDAISPGESTHVGSTREHRKRVVHAITVANTRHATSPRSFTGTSTASFDVDAVAAAARTMSGRTSHWPVPGSTPLDARVAEPVAGDEIALEDLCQFLADPDRYVTRHTMGVTLPYDDGDLHEHLTTELDGRERYALRAMLLAKTRSLFLPDADEIANPATNVGDLDDAATLARHAAELKRWARATDQLPVGTTGDYAFATEWKTLLAIRSKVSELREARSVWEDRDIAVALPDGRQLVGTLPCLIADDPAKFDNLVLDYGVTNDIKPHERLVALTKLLAIAAADPTNPWWTVVVRRQRNSATTFQQQIDPSATTEISPIAALGDLVRLLDVAKLGAVPLPTGLISLTNASWQSNWRDKFVETFVKKAPPRFLYGYLDADDFRSAPVHPDDPGLPDDSKRPGTTDRPDHLRSVIFQQHLAKHFQSSRTKKGLVTPK